MTTSTSKPKILLIGKIRHANKEWNELSDIAELVVGDFQNREEFLKAITEKYTDITAIYRTLDSVRLSGRFDKELIDHLPKSVKYICHFGAGYDQVDVTHLTERGIKFSNTPDAVAPATADANIYLMIGAIRRFALGSNGVRENTWDKGIPLGNDPKSRVLGIVGMGSIGRTVRDRAVPFGFKKIIYYNRRRLSPELEQGAEYKSTFDELIKEADVISLNLPLNKDTHHLVDKESFAKMKDGVVIVNTARGAIINEEDLVQALKSGKVGAVGLDVFEHEPNPHPELAKNPNALLLPHMGTHTYESRYDMEVTVIKNLRSCLTTGNVIDTVPEQYGKF